MVNICEPLINVVTENKSKVLGCSWAVEPLIRVHKLGPKGKGSSIGAPNSPIADGAPPGGEAEPNPRSVVLARNVVSS